MSKSAIYFARPDALNGSLVDTLKAVKPTVFFGVPRVYEKMEDKIKDVMSQAGFLKKKLSNYI